MAKIKYNISLDKLEITYQASQQVREYLATIEESKVINDISVVRVEKPQHYQHEFFLFGKDYNFERGEHVRPIGFSSSVLRMKTDSTSTSVIIMLLCMTPICLLHVFTLRLLLVLNFTE